MRFVLIVYEKSNKSYVFKRYQNARSDLTILRPFSNVTLTLCVSWDPFKDTDIPHPP